MVVPGPRQADSADFDQGLAAMGSTADAVPQAGGAHQAGDTGQAGDAGRGGHRSRLRHLAGILGPGLVTGAADDDPSGIATYSQTGAQFGYGQLWVELLAAGKAGLPSQTAGTG